MNPRRRYPGRGFTLIELMIAVAIVAILAAIAYPSYVEQVARGRRANAQAALLATAQWLERQYTISNAYNTNMMLPTLDSKTAAFYALSFGDMSGPVTPTATDYSLRMVPQGAMTNDKCGTFTLTNTGVKNVTGSTGRAACWDR